jgi:hypothetical protein
MSLSEINVDDLNKLKQFRIERLRRFFIASLQSCLIRIESGNTLMVHCPHPGIIDDLLDELEDLRNHAWMVLGVRSVALYFCQEEILRTENYRPRQKSCSSNYFLINQEKMSSNESN